ELVRVCDYRPPCWNDIRRSLGCLCCGRGVLVSYAIVHRQIVFDFVLILPIEIPRITSPVTHRGSVAEYRRIHHPYRKLGEVREVERAARRTVQKPFSFLATDMVTPAPRVPGRAERRDPGHAIE